ncbi:MAG: hypothetical protein DCC75_10695, partial [Proteobacteria bacterium]
MWQRIALTCFGAICCALSIPYESGWIGAIFGISAAAFAPISAKSGGRGSEFAGPFYLFNFIFSYSAFWWLASTLAAVFGMNDLTAGLSLAAGLAVVCLPGAAVAYLLLRAHHWYFNAAPSRYSIIFLWSASLFLQDLLLPRPFDWSLAMTLGANRLLTASVGTLGTSGLLFVLLLASSLAALVMSGKYARFTWRLIAACAVAAAIMSPAFILGGIAINKLKGEFNRLQPVALIQDNVLPQGAVYAKQGLGPYLDFMIELRRTIYKQLSKVGEEYQAKTQGDDVAPPQLWVVSGEGAIFEPIFGKDPQTKELRDGLTRFFTIPNALYFFGGLEPSPDPAKKGYFNVMAMYRNAESLGLFRKIVLFPFGEYLPFEEILPDFYKRFALSFERILRSQSTASLPHPSNDGPIFVPLICFEGVL